MKALIISGIAAGISFVLALVMVFSLIKIGGKSKDYSTGKKIRLTFLAWLFFFIFGAFGYFGIYYHSAPAAGKYMSSSESVEVRSIKGGYLFDGYGKSDVLIFYPGAKVDEKAYAPIMHRLAENGVDCIVAKMPVHMAFLKREAADTFIGSYPYENWYIGGHSLGGAMACIYSASHRGAVKGIVLLASYPSVKLAEGLKLCIIRGSRDTVINKGAYDESRGLWTKDAVEVVIEGGNHSQFGSYGLQKGDTEASVSEEEQWDIAADAILKTIKE